MGIKHFIRFITQQPPKPLFIMQCRFFLVSYLALCMDAVAAAESAVWDCGQSQDGHQWGCVSQAAPPGKAAEEPEPSREPVPGAPEKPARTSASVPASEPAAASAPEVEASAPETPIENTRTSEEKTTGALSQKSNNSQAENLVSAGQSAKTEAESSGGFRLLDPAFSHSQERIFNRLQARLKADPWGSCEISPSAPNPYVSLPTSKQFRDTAPMNIESNYSEVFDKEVSFFSGNVKIDRGDQNVLADQVNYNSFSDTMDAQGNVYYSEDELSMYSDSVLLNLITDEARLRDSLFISPRAPIRGRAGTVYRETKEFSHFKDVAYTSCQPGNQDWVIHADRLKINKLTGKAAATNAWLEFKSVPVMYTPYISFPIDDRRTTGLLTPTWSNSGQNGFDITIPYYWNIAPNYDATFRPRYLAKRGMMLGTDLRYMNTWSNSKLSFDVLFNDDKQTSSNYNKTRYQANFKNQAVLSPHTNANIDLNYVSDVKYYTELGHALSFTDFRHVRSIADINYQRKDVSFLTRIENYQTIDQSISLSQRPYRKLPQIMLNLNHDFETMPVNIGMENEFVYFQHNHNVYGQRFNVKPFISTPYKSTSGFAIPKASLLHTNYFLNDDNVANIDQVSGRPGSLNRDLPIFSLDTGLFAETNYGFGGSNFTHTLEPRLFYLYIPRANQDELPIFDTALYDINFDSLFRENRFAGVDRVQNANRVTVALTSRFLDNSNARERFKASVGNIIYFQDRDAQKVFSPDLILQNPQNPYYSFLEKETDRFSNVISEFSGQLTDGLGFTSGLQWNPYNNNKPSFPRKLIDFHYKNKSGLLFNIGFHDITNRNLSIITTNTNNTIRQSDVSGRIPLFDNWFMVGRWQYSFFYDKTAESFLGLEKENCCWRFRIIGRRYINGLNVPGTTNAIATNTAFGETQTTVMFQIELKSLSAFGDNVDTFLKRNIYGYSDL